MLVLRSGYGSADPHSRQGVARILDVGVGRVRRLERRGLREARTLSRAGACGGGSVSPVITSGGGGATDTGSVAAPTGGDSDGGGSGGVKTDTGDSRGTPDGSGDVRGESDSRLVPPALGGGDAEPGGVSLAIGITLILLALAAGFATPHLRGRLRSS